ncbi:MAG: CbiX/SirB N-terminal domain-containing protein, partial [Methanocorpusculum sp.]|nr:CbiX/SirB N-terminal domain-containing protein [Methanocorpusculum sp.]
MTRHGILLIGHGSRLEYNKQLTEDVAEMMRSRCPKTIIKTCFLEYDFPSVNEGLDEMRQES